MVRTRGPASANPLVDPSKRDSAVRTAGINGVVARKLWTLVGRWMERDAISIPPEDASKAR